MWHGKKNKSSIFPSDVEHEFKLIKKPSRGSQAVWTHCHWLMWINQSACLHDCLTDRSEHQYTVLLTSAVVVGFSGRPVCVQHWTAIGPEERHLVGQIVQSNPVAVASCVGIIRTELQHHATSQKDWSIWLTYTHVYNVLNGLVNIY